MALILSPDIFHVLIIWEDDLWGIYFVSSVSTHPPIESEGQEKADKRGDAKAYAHRLRGGDLHKVHSKAWKYLSITIQVPKAGNLDRIVESQ